MTDFTKIEQIDRAELLMHAMEGELDGLTCDKEAAIRILAHVDACGDGAAALAPALATLVEAGKRLSAQPDRMKDLRAFVEYWGLDCYTESADIRRQVRDVVMAFLVLAKETARQVMEVAPAGVTLKHLEWVNEPPFSVARTPLGVHYAIEAVWEETGGFSHIALTGGVSGRFTDGPRAKAAAQADYERRATAGAGVSTPYADGLREGLRRAADLCEHYAGIWEGEPVEHAKELHDLILSLLTKEEGQ